MNPLVIIFFFISHLTRADLSVIMTCPDRQIKDFYGGDQDSQWMLGKFREYHVLDQLCARRRNTRPPGMSCYCAIRGETLKMEVICKRPRGFDDFKYMEAYSMCTHAQMGCKCPNLYLDGDGGLRTTPFNSLERPSSTFSLASTTRSRSLVDYTLRDLWRATKNVCRPKRCVTNDHCRSQPCIGSKEQSCVVSERGNGHFMTGICANTRTGDMGLGNSLFGP